MKKILLVTAVAALAATAAQANSPFEGPGIANDTGKFLGTAPGTVADSTLFLSNNAWTDDGIPALNSTDETVLVSLDITVTPFAYVDAGALAWVDMEANPEARGADNVPIYTAMAYDKDSNIVPDWPSISMANATFQLNGALYFETDEELLAMGVIDDPAGYDGGNLVGDQPLAQMAVIDETKALPPAAANGLDHGAMITAFDFELEAGMTIASAETTLPLGHLGVRATETGAYDA